MSDFLAAVIQHPFLQHALWAGALASLSCGVVGSLVVVRRMSYLAGAIAHSVLGGMGAARYLQVTQGWTWLTPLHGAVLAALLAALIMGWVSLRAREREDTIIGALWAVGMAVGILFMAATPGYSVDLMSYLFGNILMVTTTDLWLMAGLDALVLAVGLGRYHQFLAVCFDEEFARVRGLRVDLYFLVLVGLTALTVVVLSAVVGIIMVIALLTLPAAMAGRFAGRLWQIMAGAVFFSLVFTTLGLGISYGLDLPSGAFIIVLIGAAYLVLALATGRRGLWRPR